MCERFQTKCLTHEFFYKIRIQNKNKLKLVVFLKMFPRSSQLMSLLEYFGLESVLICTQCTGLYADVSISLHFFRVKTCRLEFLLKPEEN